MSGGRVARGQNELGGSLVGGAMPFVRLIVGVLVMVTLVGDASAGPFETKQRTYARVREAFEAHRAAVEAAFRAEGAAWPPRGIYLRAFKLDGVLELWAEKVEAGRGPAERVLVRNFPICAASGELGPKRREGDGQVPEGFYTIDRFNPRSSYHLSLGVDYPNAVDRARAAGDPPGGDIFIHGGCVTIGCLPLQDTPIAWLYVAAVVARDRGQDVIPVHVFPFRFGTAEAGALMAAAPVELRAFWGVLARGHAAFEATRVPPAVRATRKGYVIGDR